MRLEIFDMCNKKVTKEKSITSEPLFGTYMGGAAINYHSIAKYTLENIVLRKIILYWYPYKNESPEKLKIKSPTKI